MHEGADFVPHSAVVVKGFFFRSGELGQAGRVVEAGVDDFGFSGENGAAFIGVGAHGNDVIKGNVSEFIDVLRALARDVDPGFSHDLHGIGVEAVGFDAGGVGLDLIAFERAGEALGHLAAAGVAGAEEEDSELVF